MKRVFAMLAVGAVAACDLGSSPGERSSFGYSFDLGEAGWVADFTDYAVGAEEVMELGSGHAPLPAPLSARSGFMLTGINHSDDLFMYIRLYQRGLVPAAQYRVTFTVTFATDAPAGCVGAGGSPGESVVVKGGASRQQPVPVEQGGEYRLSVDKGEQLGDGPAAIVLGNVATTNTNCASRQWQMKTLESGNRAVSVTADNQGAVWLFVGVESGFEARSTVYFTDVDVRLTRVF